MSNTLTVIGNQIRVNSNVDCFTFTSTGITTHKSITHDHGNSVPSQDHLVNKSHIQEMIDASIGSAVTDLQWKEAVFIAPDADEISATTNASLSAVDNSNSGYILFTRESGQGGANGITIDGETIFSHGQNETISDAAFTFGELMAITSYDSNAHDTNKYGAI